LTVWTPLVKRLVFAMAIGALAVLAASGMLQVSFKAPQVDAAQVEALTGALNTLSSELSAQPTDGSTAAAVDYFLKIDGIPGESTDEGHKDEIDVLSWSWGETNAGSSTRGGGGGAGKVSMQDFHFTMKVNKASPKLMLACATGQHIKEAVLTVRKAGESQQEFLVIKFSDLLVSSYQTGGSGGVVPTDQVSLNFSKIEFEYRPQNPDGTLGAPVKAGYDLKLNKKV
jgi:type VI secretion system secreted protein Hcp